MASKGRIVYREPNEFAAKKYTYRDDNMSKNNITWQQEDFNLLVDLDVVIPNRWGYYDSSSDNNISLLQGSELNDDYYLTTDYVNVGYSEISNNTKSKREYLGIDSIDIKFDSHFYPIVNIHFTDVRASSLFMTQEEEYKNGLYQDAYEKTGEEEYKKKIKPYSNLFKSFFTFPYPKFLLTVKGFYGTKVTFMLSVAEFKSGLDAKSGNFSVDVQFIGYLYGMYTDIPMTYLFAAPYMEDNFEESYWSKQIANGKFKTMDGSDIPTFNELYHKILELETTNSGLTEPLETDEIKLCNNKIRALDEIKVTYEKFIGTFQNYKSEQHVIKEKDKIALIYEVGDNTGQSVKTQYRFPVDKYESLGGLIKSYNTDNPDDTLTTDFYNTIIEGAEIGADGKYYYREHGTSNSVNTNAIISGKQSQTRKSLCDLLEQKNFSKEKIKLLKNNKAEIYNYEIINISEYKKIGEIVEKYTEKINAALAKEQTKAKYTRAVKLLGFEPTIQNIMRIVFAHMDTFIHYFYELYGNIYAGQTKRTFIATSVSKEDTDANVVGGENYLPPFFALYKETEDGKKVHEYPGNNIHTSNIEEVKYVERLVDSAFIVGSAFGNSERAYASTLSTDIKYSLMSDIDCFMQGVNIYAKYEGINLDIGNNTDNIYKNFCNAVGERLFNFLNETATYSQLGVSSDINDLFFFDNSEKSKCRHYVEYEYSMLKEYLLERLSHPAITYIYKKDKDTFKKDLVKIFNELITKRTVRTLVGTEYTDNIKQSERLVLLPYKGVNKEMVDIFINSLTDKAGQDKYFGHIYHKPQSDITHDLIITSEENDSERSFTIETYRNNVKESKTYYKYIGNLNNIEINNESTLYYDKYIGNTYLYDKSFEDKKNGVDREKIAFDLLSHLVEYYFVSFTDKPYKLPLLTKGDILILPKFFMLYFGAILYRFKKMLNGEEVFYNDKPLYEWTGFYKNGSHVSYLPEKGNDSDYVNDVGFYPLEFILNQEYDLIIDVEHTNDEFKKYDNSPFVKAVISLENLRNKINNVGKCEKLFIDFLDENSSGVNFESIFRELTEDSFEIVENTEMIVQQGTVSRADSITVSYKLVRSDSYLNKVILSFISEWYIMYSNDARNQLFFLKNNSTNKDIYNNYKTTFENITGYYYDRLREDFEIKINNYELQNSTAKDSIINNDIGNVVYYNLKNLNDKWLCSNGKDHDKWQLKSPQDTNKYKSERFEKKENKKEDNEYDSFIFVDSFFNDIGDDLIVNLPMLRKRIEDTKSITANKQDCFTSVFQFINGIAQDNKLLFVSIPIYSNFHDDESLERIFTPNPSYASGITQGTTYVMMYTHEFSKNLGVNGYENDGFDIGNTIEEISNECGTIFAEATEDKINYKVPAFGVTYGMQNQNYFTNISVNMDNPQTTDYGILNTIQIAQSTENGDQNSGILIGQNIYSIYSNRSYTCTVEMLGCMNIMPMMYFQLNNIPMFKGAYMIISVSHQITGGNRMTTKFTGVRISKYLNSLLDSDSLVLKTNLEQKTTTPVNAYIDQYTIGNSSLGLYNITEEMRHFTYEDMEKDNTKIPEKYKDNAKLLITKILDPLYDAWIKETGKKFYINSGYRNDRNYTSAHNYAMAADIITESIDNLSPIESNDRFKEFTCKWLQKNNIQFDQFIDEYSKPKPSDKSGWIHIAVLNPSYKQRKQYMYTDWSTRPGGAQYKWLKSVYPSWFTGYSTIIYPTLLASSDAEKPLWQLT